MYCEAVFTRGTGLGNRLFPWARCKLFARDRRCPMLAPRWAHLRTGPLRKGGIRYADAARKVLLWGNFVAGPAEVVGWRRLLVRWRYRRVAEPHGPLDTPDGPFTLVTFRGEGRRFRDLAGHERYLLDQLNEAARPRWRQGVSWPRRLPVAVNIRRAKDFRDARSPEAFLREGALRTPLEWFVLALSALRRALGQNVEAYVVSDGTAADLAPVLRLPAVHHVNDGSAVADLLTLSRACVLIGSGGSSFSAWGAFLGQSPVLTIAGQSLEWFQLESTSERFVGVWDGGTSLDPFWEAAAASLRRHGLLS